VLLLLVVAFLQGAHAYVGQPLEDILTAICGAYGCVAPVPLRVAQLDGSCIYQPFNYGIEVCLLDPAAPYASAGIPPFRVARTGRFAVADPLNPNRNVAADIHIPDLHRMFADGYTALA
jgi:hypothetical protein